MNRVERAARRRVAGDNAAVKVFEVTSVEAPAGRPVAATPMAFAAGFGVGYAVAMAFGPADSVERAAYAQVPADQLAAEDLIARRRAAVA